MTHVASGAFLRRQIAVFLRNRRLIHGRTEIRRIRQSLGERVVGQQAESVRIPLTHVHVARVVPALRGIFETIDCADRKRLALYDRARIAAGR